MQQIESEYLTAIDVQLHSNGKPGYLVIDDY